MAERGVPVNHTTVWRWVQVYAPEVHRRLQRQVKYKRATRFMDENQSRIAGGRMYLFRPVDNRGQTVDCYLSETRNRDAAKRFLQAPLSQIRTIGGRMS